MVTINSYGGEAFMEPSWNHHKDESPHPFARSLA